LIDKDPNTSQMLYLWNLTFKNFLYISHGGATRHLRFSRIINDQFVAKVLLSKPTLAKECFDKKALLSQRWPRDAPYVYL